MHINTITGGGEGGCFQFSGEGKRVLYMFLKMRSNLPAASRRRASAPLASAVAAGAALRNAGVRSAEKRRLVGSRFMIVQLAAAAQLRTFHFIRASRGWSA